ncbi:MULTISPECIES: hypothetical protein [unclassified Chryseobacterium]|uniref:hypothetical protein n=1 Tax=unclassified Chryseobacterium TaxID=2593645 RepID=UPI000F4AE5E5|nr:hypothetical protein [Chryseobacterium sp. BIGb0232]MCS4305571.1 hypothetical protein [Chryseobacterium sp. BIGb0232]ROS06577.1 hypothetical protein EDF65_5122 [Chryseobacterium nakagawai]
MKKIFLYILVGSLCFSACKKDDEIAFYTETRDLTNQNGDDDQAIKKFMDENYLDAAGNIKPFSATDTADDHEKKLSQLNPVTLPSGTIYIMRDGAQPAVSNPIQDKDIIRIMGRAYTFLSRNNNGVVSFIEQVGFFNTIEGGSTVPVIDPMYYYTKKKVMDDATVATAKKASYYQIPGFREALQKFSAFNLPDEAPYNLQGVIIVPSRAAFARNSFYPYLGIDYSNRSFVFNFQIYGRENRPADQIQTPEQQ